MYVDVKYVHRITDTDAVLSEPVVTYVFVSQINTTIEKIDLEGNRIGSSGCVYIARVLKDNLYVTDLVSDDVQTFVGYCFGSNCNKYLCRFLIYSCKTHIHFSCKFIQCKTE